MLLAHEDLLLRAFDAISAGKRDKTSYNDLLHYLGFRAGIIWNPKYKRIDKNLITQLDDMFAGVPLPALPADCFAKLGVVKDSIDADRAAKYWAGVENAVRSTMAPVVVYVEKCGTGSLLVSLGQAYGTRVMLCGREPDILTYRTCLVNLAMHGIRAYVIKDSGPAPTSLSDPRWLKANKW